MSLSFRGRPRIEAWENKSHSLDFQKSCNLSSLFWYSDVKRLEGSENPGIVLEQFNSFLASQFNKMQCPKVSITRLKMKGEKESFTADVFI